MKVVENMSDVGLIVKISPVYGNLVPPVIQAECLYRIMPPLSEITGAAPENTEIPRHNAANITYLPSNL